MYMYIRFRDREKGLNMRFQIINLDWVALTIVRAPIGYWVQLLLLKEHK